MHKTRIIGILLIAILLVLGGCAPKPAPAPAPPEFEVISLDVIPTEVTAGETAKITAIVKNVGGSVGTYAIILSVDGVTAEAKETAPITPGSSTVVTFSLIKDAPGTYGISIGEFSLTLVVKEEPVAKKVELKYDDGEIKLLASQGPGWGYSVHFSPPATPFTISKVKVLARLYGTEYADRLALLEIWNEDFDALYSREMPASEFSEAPRWVTVETNITVDGDFRVVFFTNSGQEAGGISIGYDLSGNEASEVVKADGTIADWREQWESEPSPKPRETTNWMIRVIGTYMAPAD